MTNLPDNWPALAAAKRGPVDYSLTTPPCGQRAYRSHLGIVRFYPIRSCPHLGHEAAMSDLTAQELSDLLAKLGACSESRRWSQGKTLSQAWRECQVGEWLDWFIQRVVHGREVAEWVCVTDYDNRPSPTAYDGCLTVAATASCSLIHRSQLKFNTESLRASYTIDQLVAASRRAMEPQ